MPIRRALAALVLLAMAAAAFAPTDGGPALADGVRVVDGDTLEVSGRKIRLHGVDAPEKAQTCLDACRRVVRCGVVATEAMERLVAKGRLACRTIDTDRYGRTVARCRAGGVDVGEALVAAGLARAYTRYSEDYADEEAEARRASLGMWAGEAVAPWDWRRGERLMQETSATAEAPSADCRIKGNVSGSGRVYHVPGSRWYERTTIDPAQGERWFCSEAEARAAGWRAPRG
ncbi:MAG: thermonuclease family protein [Paracoccaceae bacterium]